MAQERYYDCTLKRPASLHRRAAELFGVLKSLLSSRMPSPKGLNPEDLEEQARVLQQLIDDAQALQQQITDHLRKIRRENRVSVAPPTERRKRSR